MKRILRSKLVLTLAAFLMIAAAVVIPLSGNIIHSHAQAPASITQTFTVQATQDLPGLDTGIDLAVGNGITITASGQAAFGTNSNQDCSTTQETIPSGQRITADGTLCPGKIDPDAVLPQSPVGTLIAQIGSAGWIAVGSSDGFNVTTSGRLFLLYNDIPGQYDNNSGTYQVTVTVTSAPTPTVSFMKAATPKVAPGGTISYTLTLTNITQSGSGNLHDIHLNDTPPAQTSGTFTAPTFTITPPGSATVDCASSTTTSISCAVDDFALGSVVTVSFSTTASSRATGTITNTAIAANNLGTIHETATAKTMVTAPTTRKPLVIFLQGINTSLTDKDIKFGAIGVGMGSIPTQVIKSLPKNAQFLNYSYNGSNSKGEPVDYGCDRTFTSPILKDITLLNDQITKAVGNQTNIDIYLIGHSLGGVVAFGYMAAVEEGLPRIALPAGARLKAVITLDSPLGGVPSGTFGAFAKFIATKNLEVTKISGFPVIKIGNFPCNELVGTKTPLTTVDDLGKIFNSATPTTPTDDGLPGSDPQGALASVLAISGVKLPLSLIPTNEQLAETAQTKLGTSFLSIGTREDFLWNPAACANTVIVLNEVVAHVPLLSQFASVMDAIPNFTATQFLEDEGAKSGLYSRSFTVPGAILGIHICDVASMTNSLNHLEVLTNGEVLKGLAHFLSPLGATPDPLSPVPSKDAGPV